jgi:uncharacterized membrane protein YccC
MLAFKQRSPFLSRVGVIHSLRTAIATVVALALARLLSMPEAFWAPISTIIVMQSTLGASWTVSKQRLIGTLMGALCGGILAGHLASDITVLGVGILALGLLCTFLRLDQSAYRFAGVTFAIVLLVARAESAWLIGLHRFIEVSIGIGVGLATAAIWPERAPAK